MLTYIKEKFETSEDEEELRIAAQAEIKLGGPLEEDEEDDEDDEA